MNIRFSKWSRGTAIFMVTMSILAVAGLQWIGPLSILKPFRSFSDKIPADHGFEYEQITLATFDSVHIKGYWIPFPGDSAKASVIFLHGIGGCKEHFIDLAAKVSLEGYHTLVFDARAHGESQGKHCTYGIREKKDISMIADFIYTKAPDLPIGVWGNSLGGAVALQALASDERLAFGIVESTFTSLRRIVFDYNKRITGLRMRWLTDHILTRAGRIAGFNPDDVAPIDLVGYIEQPILIAHGNADANISVEYGKELFAGLASDSKELVIIDGGNHYDTRLVGGEDYLKKVFRFLEKALQQPIVTE